jgi:peptidyl-tRNA hydrolase, PTH2 family
MTIKQVIVVRKDLNMRKGKLAAQVAHASMKFLTENFRDDTNFLTVELARVERNWLADGFAKVVVSVNSEQELLDLIAQARVAGIKVKEIVDLGRTEFHGVPTLTCAAFGPDEAEKIDEITGKLSLL